MRTDITDLVRAIKDVGPLELVTNLVTAGLINEGMGEGWLKGVRV